MIIVDLIKEFMYQSGMSVNELVDKTGLSYLIIKNIVDNDMIPTPEVAEKILNVFGVTLEEVLSLY